MVRSEDNKLGLYILEGRKAVPCGDGFVWGKWMESNQRHVAKSRVGGFYISTVFLGLNHQWEESEVPLLFETMVFKEGNWSELACKRYSTWDEAQKGHDEAVRDVLEGRII